MLNITILIICQIGTTLLQIQPPIAEGVIYTDPQTGARYKLSPDQPENKTNAMEFRVGETGLGATPEKKIYSLEDQLLYGTKRK
jgi:hypothetical protein